MGKVLTPAEAARELGPSFTPARVRQLLRDGHLPRVRIGRRWYVANLDGWLNEHASDVAPARSTPRTVDAAITALIAGPRRFK